MTLETTGQQGGSSPRVIKRYANRKLYDTRDSRYVTLQQIAQFVRDGEEVTIIDNTTKEDLTNVTLAQIIYEEEKNAADGKRATIASVGTLRTMIQQSGERLMTTLREGPVGKLISRSQPPDAAPEPEPAPEPETPAKKGVFASSKDALDELQRLADDRMRGLLGHAITHVQQLQGEVKRLQARIEELEDRLVKLSRRKDEVEDEPKDQ
jgi:polyhydroxyalkanoate synthesis repressor PhaR